MTQTQNYQLNQWEATDQVKRTDFNADNAKIDAALAALQTAVNGKGNCRIITGTRTGTGGMGESNPTVFTFDKKPLVLMIPTQAAILFTVQGADRAIYLTMGYPNSCHAAWEGNSVSLYSTIHADHQANEAGRVYRYFVLQEA